MIGPAGSDAGGAAREEDERDDEDDGDDDEDDDDGDEGCDEDPPVSAGADARTLLGIQRMAAIDDGGH